MKSTTMIQVPVVGRPRKHLTLSLDHESDAVTIQVPPILLPPKVNLADLARAVYDLQGAKAEA